MRIVCVGEAMLELSRTGEAWTLGYGGDTLNTAIHLARAGHDVAYLTALGCDPLTADLREKWAAEGLDTSLILSHPTRSTGLYAINTDASGERSFTYWRDTSAAREMFALPEMAEAVAQVEQAELLVFSLISLAILPVEGRMHLLDLASLVRANGGKVAFDGNYRPRLWASVSEACHWRDAAIAVADIGLPTLEDELALNSSPSLLGEGDHPKDGGGVGGPDAGLPLHRSASGPPPQDKLGEDLETIAAHWTQRGCSETIVKLGADGARLPDGQILPPPEVLSPIDTSGAGDAFNGGYLAARMDGASVEDAVMAGHRLAGWCVMRRGAIPPRNIPPRDG